MMPAHLSYWNFLMVDGVDTDLTLIEFMKWSLCLIFRRRFGLTNTQLYSRPIKCASRACSSSPSSEVGTRDDYGNNNSVNNNNNPGRIDPQWSSGYTYNDAPEKCERPECQVTGQDNRQNAQLEPLDPMLTDEAQEQKQVLCSIPTQYPFKQQCQPRELMFIIYLY